MMLGVLQSNRENVLNSITQLQQQLDKLQTALSDEDYATFESILHDAQRAYQFLIPNP